MSDPAPLPHAVYAPEPPKPYTGPLDPNGPVWPLLIAVIRRVWPNATTAVVGFLAGILGAPLVNTVNPVPPSAVAPATAEPSGNRIRRMIEQAETEAARREGKRAREEVLAVLDYFDQTKPLGEVLDHIRYEIEPEPGELPEDPVP